MTAPLAVLQFAERMEKEIKDWGERPHHWIVTFKDGTTFQISKDDPLLTKQTSGLQPKLARGKARKEI